MAKKGVKSFFKGFGWTVLIVFLVFLVFLAFGHINNRWYKLIYVKSDSMTPLFKSGDLIFITKPPYEIKPGMVVSFQVKNDIVTHRVVAVSDDGSITTQGDANNVIDDWGNLKIKKIGGIYRFKIPYLGYPIAYTSGWLKGSVLPNMSAFFQEKVPNFFQKAFSMIQINGTSAFFTDQKSFPVSISMGTTPPTEAPSGALSLDLGNAGALGQEPVESTLTIDNFSINNDEISCSSKDVGLTINVASSGLLENLEMRLVNDIESWTDEQPVWEPYATTKIWQLSDGDGEKWVFIQIRNQNNQDSIVSASDSILFTEPTETTIEMTGETIPSN